KRAGLKNLHLVNLLPNATMPLPLYLHGSHALKSDYLLRVPPLPDPEVKLGLLLSKTLAERLKAAKLPKGLTAGRLTAKELDQIKQYWLKQEMRSDASWERFLKTFDTTRQYSVDRRSKGVDLPALVKADQREEVMLLV